MQNRESVSKCSVVIRNSSIVREMAEIAKTGFGSIRPITAAASTLHQPMSVTSRQQRKARREEE